MGELITGHGEDLPPFLKKGRKGKKKPDADMSHAVAEGGFYLNNLFLQMELEETQRRAKEDEREVRSLQMRAGSLQNTLEESAAYNRLLLRGIRGLNLELSDAYGQLADVPQRLGKVWEKGYIARVKEEAARRIENRRRGKENAIGRWAVNLVRNKAASLIRNTQFLLTGK